MDGLLVNTEKTYTEGWIFAIKETGLDVPTDVIYSWVGKSVHETTTYLNELTGNPLKTQKLRQLREIYFYDQLHLGQVGLKSYAKNILDLVKSKGLMVGLATSTSKQRAQDILSYHNIDHYFDYPTYGDSVSLLKPHPDIYLEVLRRANVPSNRAIVIEDSITGAKAATDASLATILVPDINFQLDASQIPERVFLVGQSLKQAMQWLVD